MQRRSAAVRLTITAMLAASLSACSSGPSNVGICVDPKTQQRVPDSECGNDYNSHIYNGGGSGFFWYFVGRNSVYPPIGGRYSAGSFVRPAAAAAIGHAAVSGGRVARGGFGGLHSSGRS